MKITHIIFSFKTGGAETMLVDIVNHQVIIGHEVSLIVINDSYSNELLSKVDKRVHLIMLRRAPSSSNPLYVIRLNLLISRIKSDVIHLHNESIIKLLFIKSPIFLTVHSLNIKLSNACKKIVELIAISEAVKEDIEQHYPQLYHVKVISNGIRVDDIQRKQVYGIRGVMKVVQVGSIIPFIKGQDLLIEALSLLKNRGLVSIEVSFIGEPYEKDALTNKAHELNVEKQIRFLGLKDRDYIYSHLKDYDLMCHPSRYEGFGLTVAEGIAAGLPVLVPDADGPYEIIQQGKWGYTFKKGDAYSLADSLQDIYEHYHERITSVVDNAYFHVKQNYSIESMVAQYIQEYNRFLK